MNKGLEIMEALWYLTYRLRNRCYHFTPEHYSFDGGVYHGLQSPDVFPRYAATIQYALPGRNGFPIRNYPKLDGQNQIFNL